MKERLSLAFSAAALAVAVLGVTPLGHAAGDALATAASQAKGPLQAMGMVSQARRGPRGPRGRRGPRGFRGPTGLSGARGVKGDKGDRGVKGTTGDQGPPGIQGNQGIQGVQGNPGNPGPKGPTGPKGFDGIHVVRQNFSAIHGSWTTGIVTCPDADKPHAVGGGV